MLNPFPTLLDFSLLAPLLIRVVAGFIFIDLGFFKLTRERERWHGLYKTFLKLGQPFLAVVAFIELIGGALLIVGMFTQVAALALSIITFSNLYLEWKEPAFVRRDFVFYLMLLTMTASLLVTGAGIFAFDLPL